MQSPRALILSSGDDNGSDVAAIGGPGSNATAVDRRPISSSGASRGSGNGLDVTTAPITFATVCGFPRAALNGDQHHRAACRSAHPEASEFCRRQNLDGQPRIVFPRRGTGEMMARVREGDKRERSGVAKNAAVTTANAYGQAVSSASRWRRIPFDSVNGQPRGGAAAGIPTGDVRDCVNHNPRPAPAGKSLAPIRRRINGHGRCR